MFTRRLAAGTQRSWRGGRKLCRSFSYSDINFSNAFIAFKINKPDQSIQVQFNLPDKSFEMDLSSSHSLKDVENFLIENKFCQ